MMTDLLHNEYYRNALEYISGADLCELTPGKHVLDGDNLFVNIVDCKLKTVTEAKLEVHDSYIDIQVPLSGPETFGVKLRKECKFPVGEFDTEKDIQFFEDKVENTITVLPGEPVTFAPEMAHAPLIGDGTIHKAIFKVKVK